MQLATKRFFTRTFLRVFLLSAITRAIFSAAVETKGNQEVLHVLYFTRKTLLLILLWLSCYQCRTFYSLLISLLESTVPQSSSDTTGDPGTTNPASTTAITTIPGINNYILHYTKC